jgi:nucleotidyltransferase/DNA polymerase involved in DNA repair
MSQNERRIIAHVDMDSFFTAVEVLDDPSLRGLPVIVGADPVGGQGRGVVSAASYEARRFGVHAAMPISQAYRLCPHAAFRPGRMRRYSEVSERVMATLEGFTPQIEQVSVDEAFLDLSGCRRLWGDCREMGTRIKIAVHDGTGLTASVGIGPNKLVAKIASDLRKPDGLLVVAPEEVKMFLSPLPIRRLWGVGPRTEDGLTAIGIRTIGDLARAGVDDLERRFGKAGSWLFRSASGVDDDPVSAGDGQKSIGRETTFAKDTSDAGLVERTLLGLCEDVAARMRRHGLQGRTLTLKIRYRGFDTHTCRKTVAEATDVTSEIWERARSLFSLRLQTGRPVRLIGVALSNFSSDGGQPDLFDPAPPLRRKRRLSDAAADAVRAKFGTRALFRAARLDPSESSET